MCRAERRMAFQFPIDAQDDRIRTKVDVETTGIEHLRYEAAIGQGDFIADAELAGRRRQQLLDGPEATGDPMLSPLLLLLLADVDQHD